MNNYKRLFEQISSNESDEVLVSRVMARKADIMKENNMHKHFGIRKAVVIPAAAVLVVGAVTVSVGAANNWDYARAFRGMFAQKYEGNVSVTEQEIYPDSVPAESGSAPEQTVELVPEKEIGTFDFEKYGKPLDIVMEGDGITAKLDGMLVYDDMCYIMYTVTATDELLETTGGVIPGLRIDFGNFGFRIDNVFAGGMGYSTEIISEDGNTETGCIKISYDTVDLAGKTLNIDFLAETKAGDPDTAILSCHKDIPIDFNLPENIEKELSVDFRLNSFDGVINRIKVSGLKSDLYFSGNITDAPDMAYYDAITAEDGQMIEDIETPEVSVIDEITALGDAVVTLKDGTTVTAKGGVVRTYGGENGKTDGCIELHYTYPLNPDDVQSIAFGDFVIGF